MDNDGYRLPNIEELKDICTVKNISKLKWELDYYWASTICTYNMSKAWSMNFRYGYDGMYYKGSSYYIRAVREGQYREFDNSDRFQVLNKDEVMDTKTKLIWKTEIVRLNWYDATEYVENLNNL